MILLSLFCSLTIVLLIAFFFSKFKKYFEFFSPASAHTAFDLNIVEGQVVVNFDGFKNLVMYDLEDIHDAKNGHRCG